jgi:putative acetyltransferase
VIIRAEQNTDHSQVETVIMAAFLDHPHSDQSEHHLVNRLREQGGLTLALVAESDGRIVGQIAFSEVTINGQSESWLGLAPVSVDPGFQNQGIGSKLVRAGLEAIRSGGARGCVLVGEPGYYGRFGFRHEPLMTLNGVPPQYFQALSFDGKTPAGQVRYHTAFGMD